jgi:hypothetical protein
MFAAMVVVLAFTGIWERVLALPCLGLGPPCLLASQGIHPDDQLHCGDVVLSELLRQEYYLQGENSMGQ